VGLRGGLDSLEWRKVSCLCRGSPVVCSVFSLRYKLYLYVKFKLIFFFRAVPWLRQLFSDLLGFDPRPVHVRSVVDKVTLGQVFLQVLRFHPVSIIQPMLHTHLHLYVAHTRRDKSAKPGNLPKSNALSEIGEHWREK
jgi:hypothetical protein